jgi:hypothetical protein
MSGQMPAVGDTDIDKLRRYHGELGAFIAQIDAGRSPVDRVSRHIRRHLPLYALAAVFALIVVLIPTTNERGATDSASSLTAGDNGATTTGPVGSGSSGQTANGATVSGAAGTQSAGTGLPAGGASVAPGVSKVAAGTGVTRGGYPCKPGVRQLPWSTYAPPCVAKFVGNNGGKTYRGVDAKTITIAIRHWAITADNTTDAQNLAAGRFDRAGAFAQLKKYKVWFEKNFELYGRTVNFVDYQSKSSNNINEAQSKDQEHACADAAEIAGTLHAFGDVGYAVSLIESQPFAHCAKEQHIFVPFGASYFPESGVRESYVKWDPYVWHVYMECTRIVHDFAEYIGKRLLNAKAKWAKDAAYQQRTRKFGVYVPENPGYQHCVNIGLDDLHRKYGGPQPKAITRYDYQLDVTKFPQEAEQAVIKFHSQGVTTLINACDTLSTRFLTEAADKQGWGPEWFMIGVALQDTDGQARTWNQSVVDGHLFGMSQLGAARLIEGKTGEAYRSWTTAFGKQAPPQGYGDLYYRVLLLYTMLQAAGPVLTPENIARGLHALPDGGGAHGPFGTWSFKGDHTAIDDAREIYYVGKATGYDGKPGAYIETYGGRRFRSGQWPRGAPPIYPKK